MTCLKLICTRLTGTQTFPLDPDKTKFRCKFFGWSPIFFVFFCGVIKNNFFSRAQTKIGLQPNCASRRAVFGGGLGSRIGRAVVVQINFFLAFFRTPIQL